MKNRHAPLRVAAVILGIRFVLGLTVLPGGLSAQVTIRPISDFLNTQGKFCFPDGKGGCLLFVPPIPNSVGWADALCKSSGMSCLGPPPSPNSGNFAFVVDKFVLVDYAGVANKFLNDSLGTQVDGSIIESTLPDGSAEVNVVLHTTNALTWVAQCGTPPGNTCDFATAPLLFGHRAIDINNNDVAHGADKALGDALFQIEFTNTVPGAPLPDLVQLFFFPTAEQHFVHYVFQAIASGELREAFGVPDGTPGTVTVAQTGNISRTNSEAAVVNLRATGK